MWREEACFDHLFASFIWYMLGDIEGGFPSFFGMWVGTTKGHHRGDRDWTFYPSTGLIFLSWRMLYSSLPRVPVGMRQVWWGMCSTEVGSEQSWATNWSHITLDKARGISRYQTMCELDSIRYGTDTPSVDLSRVCLVLWQSWHWLWKTLRIFLDF